MTCSVNTIGNRFNILRQKRTHIYRIAHPLHMLHYIYDKCAFYSPDVLLSGRTPIVEEATESQVGRVI